MMHPQRSHLSQGRRCRVSAPRATSQMTIGVNVQHSLQDSSCSTGAPAILKTLRLPQGSRCSRGTSAPATLKNLLLLLLPPPPSRTRYAHQQGQTSYVAEQQPQQQQPQPAAAAAAA